MPTLGKVGRLWVPVNPLMKPRGEQVQMAADALGIKLVSLPLTYSADIGAAFTHPEKRNK